ncbi:hypothetical protein PMIN03_002409 [Paraphaeosphaeria minitans]
MPSRCLFLVPQDKDGTKYNQAKYKQGSNRHSGDRTSRKGWIVVLRCRKCRASIAGICCGAVSVLLADNVRNAVVMIGRAVGLEMVKLIELKMLLTLSGFLATSSSIGRIGLSSSRSFAQQMNDSEGVTPHLSTGSSRQHHLLPDGRVQDWSPSPKDELPMLGRRTQT